MKAFHAITAISNQPRSVLKWFEQAEKLPIKDLHDMGPYESLSNVISKWTLDLTEDKGRGRLAERINSLKEQYHVRGELLTGRRLLRLIQLRRRHLPP